MSANQRPAELLRSHPIFARVDDPGIEAFAMLLESVRFAPGTPLVRQGDAADVLFFFASGTAEVLWRAPDGRVRVMGTLGPGEALGQTALNHAARRSADVVAKTAVDTWALDLRRFGDLRQHGHTNALAVLEGLGGMLARRLRSISARVLAELGPPPTRATPPAATPPGTPQGAHDSWAAYLPLLPQFQDVSEDHVRRFLPFLREWSLPAGTRLFEEGARGQTCFITVRGSVEMCVERAGQSRRIGQFGPGRVIGELGFVDGQARAVTCIAREPAVLLEIDRPRYAALRTTDPIAATALLRIINRALSDGVALAYATLQTVTDGTANELPLVETRTESPATGPSARTWSDDQLMQRVRTARLGHDLVVGGPLGPRRVVFADHLGGARPLDFIEDTLRSELLTCLGNPGPAPRGLGLGSKALRCEAADIVKEAVGAGDGDRVHFTGYGVPGALDTLLRALNLHIPKQIDQIYRLRDRIPVDDRPVVFLSEDLATPLRTLWIDSIADVVDIPEGADGRPSLAALTAELQAHAHRPFRLACFPMLSARTGLCADFAAINTLVHQHGSLSIWDASGTLADAPVDMHPRPDRSHGTMAYADVLLIDPGTCPGGPGCPGILVGRRELLADLESVAAAEPGSEGSWIGLPDHGAVLRTAMVLQLRAALDPDRARLGAAERVAAALDRWSKQPDIRIDGDLDAPRLATVCLSITRGGRAMPADLVLTILDDVFGIQARELQGRPDHIAVDFAWYASHAEFDYICGAIEAVASGGWSLARAYRATDGAWVLPGARTPTALRLADFRYQSGTLEIHASRTLADESVLPAQLERGVGLMQMGVQAAAAG